MCSLGHRCHRLHPQTFETQHVYLHLLLADANLQPARRRSHRQVLRSQTIRPFTGTSGFNDLAFCAWDPPVFPHSVCLPANDTLETRRGGKLKKAVPPPTINPNSIFDIEDHTAVRSLSTGIHSQKAPGSPRSLRFFNSLIEVHSDPPTWV
jgi:hypothetical protein